MHGLRISPLRALALGVATDDVCAWFGLTEEELDFIAEEADARRREAPAPAGKALMTKLLRRPEMDKWETRRAER